MEHIEIASKETLYDSSIWNLYFPGRRIGVLDIETTGLSREKCCFILGGIFDLQAGLLHQVFADHTREEKETLQVFMTLVRPFDVLVTYNGRHFDLPFLKERIRRTGLAADRYDYDGYDLDLYQVVKGHSPIRGLLPNLRQKTVESYLGLWSDRRDEISGAESVELYMHYMLTEDAEARRQILLHNSDDVLQLTRLSRVIGKCDFHSAMNRMGFPAGAPFRRWQVRRISCAGTKISIEGSQGRGKIDYRGYSLGDFPMYTAFDRTEGTFRMEIPLLRRGDIAAVDLQAAGLDERKFEKYPGFGSGFLVVQDKNGVKYRETNHFVKEIIQRFEETL